jgi:hypothetical protein
MYNSTHLLHRLTFLNVSDNGTHAGAAPLFGRHQGLAELLCSFIIHNGTVRARVATAKRALASAVHLIDACCCSCLFVCSFIRAHALCDAAYHCSRSNQSIDIIEPTMETFCFYCETTGSTSTGIITPPLRTCERLYQSFDGLPALLFFVPTGITGRQR